MIFKNKNPWQFYKFWGLHFLQMISKNKLIFVEFYNLFVGSSLMNLSMPNQWYFPQVKRLLQMSSKGLVIINTRDRGGRKYNFFSKKS